MNLQDANHIVSAILAPRAPHVERFSDKRYPYTYCHDLIRQRGYADTRAEAADLLNRLADITDTPRELLANKFADTYIREHNIVWDVSGIQR